MPGWFLSCVLDSRINPWSYMPCLSSCTAEQRNPTRSTWFPKLFGGDAHQLACVLISSTLHDVTGLSRRHERVAEHLLVETLSHTHKWPCQHARNRQLCSQFSIRDDARLPSFFWPIIGHYSTIGCVRQTVRSQVYWILKMTLSIRALSLWVFEDSWLSCGEGWQAELVPNIQ